MVLEVTSGEPEGLLMRLAVGSDHAGLPLKEAVIQALRDVGAEGVDLGTFTPDPVDYPDYAAKVAAQIIAGTVDRGVLICGSGVGASIAANKIHGIRAGLCHDTFSAHQGVEHDDMNLLCLGARIIGPALAIEIVHAFVRAHFTNEERHRRRVAKTQRLEDLGVPSALDPASTP
jgi:ribose 5-phosphate isomerase B